MFAGTVWVTMFEYFPKNRRWSTAVNVALMAGATLGELHQWLEPLRTSGHEPTSWQHAWTDAALHQELLAERDDSNGFRLSASRRSLRAVVYHTISEWYTPPGPDKAECYSAALQAFAKAREYGALPVERIDARISGGTVPGYLSSGSIIDSGHRLVVICAGGPDLPKELTYCILGDAFARAGLDVLVVDFPGSGEALRLGGMAARPDSEVTAAALIDDLEERDTRAIAVGVLGLGGGGYHAIRAAALEPRIAACATWGGIATTNGPWPDWVTAGEHSSDGAEGPSGGAASAGRRTGEWLLDDILPSLIQPLLILCGAGEAVAPIKDVLTMVDAVPAMDKTVWLFEDSDGGTERLQADQPDAARDMLTGWFDDRLDRVVRGMAHDRSPGARSTTGWATTAARLQLAVVPAGDLRGVEDHAETTTGGDPLGWVGSIRLDVPVEDRVGDLEELGVVLDELDVASEQHPSELLIGGSVLEQPGRPLVPFQVLALHRLQRRPCHDLIAPQPVPERRDVRGAIAPVRRQLQTAPSIDHRADLLGGHANKTPTRCEAHRTAVGSFERSSAHWARGRSSGGANPPISGKTSVAISSISWMTSSVGCWAQCQMRMEYSDGRRSHSATNAAFA